MDAGQAPDCRFSPSNRGGCEGGERAAVQLGQVGHAGAKATEI